MNQKFSMTLAIRAFTLTGVVVALLLAGCESQNRVVATETCEQCPECMRETRIQPITGLQYTKCYCPTCKQVLTVDPMLVDDLLRFTGPNVGESVTVCEGCGTIIEQCAHCRQATASL